MTPKEKAEELVQKFRIHQPVWEVEGDSKQHALIAVDEILKLGKKIPLETLEYYVEVKSEIEKL